MHPLTFGRPHLPYVTFFPRRERNECREERKRKKRGKKKSDFSKYRTLSSPAFLPFDHSIFASTRLLFMLSSSVSTTPSPSPSFLSSSRVVSLDGIPVLSVKEACDESLPYFSLGVAQRKKANRNLRFTMQARRLERRHMLA